MKYPTPGVACSLTTESPTTNVAGGGSVRKAPNHIGETVHKLVYVGKQPSTNGYYLKNICRLMYACKVYNGFYNAFRSELDYIRSVIKENKKTFPLEVTGKIKKRKEISI